MNHKILKYAKKNGFCCLWAFLEANRAKLTSDIEQRINAEIPITRRAIRTARAKHRQGQDKCEQLESCLKRRIRDGHKIP